jgi:hypothetical protein
MRNCQAKDGLVRFAAHPCVLPDLCLCGIGTLVRRGFVSQKVRAAAALGGKALPGGGDLEAPPSPKAGEPSRVARSCHS